MGDQTGTLQTTLHGSEHVIARKLESAGRVRVHGFRRNRYREDTFETMTDCGLTLPPFDRSWLWVELRTLNPEMIVFCQKCLPAE